MTTSMSCSMNRKVTPSSARRRCMWSSSRRPSVGLMPAIGSSRSRKRGCAISARASSSSLRCPPESVPAYSSASRVRLKTSSSSIACSWTSRLARAPAERAKDHVGQALARLVGRGEHHVVDHRHRRQRLGDLERPHHPEAGDHVRRPALDLAPVEHRPAPVGPVEAGDQVEEGGLAGAVRPDQRRDRALVDVHGRAADGLDAAEALVDLGRLEELAAARGRRGGGGRPAGRQSPRTISSRLPNAPCGRNAISPISTRPRMMNRSAAIFVSESGSSRKRRPSSTVHMMIAPIATPQ